MVIISHLFGKNMLIPLKRAFTFEIQRSFTNLLASNARQNAFFFAATMVKFTCKLCNTVYQLLSPTEKEVELRNIRNVLETLICLLTRTYSTAKLLQLFFFFFMRVSFKLVSSFLLKKNSVEYASNICDF